MLIAWPSLRVKGPYLAMVTLAFGIVVEKLVSEWTEVFGGAQGIYGIKSLDLERPAVRERCNGSGSASRCAPSRTCCCATCCCGRFGRALLSLQADEIAADVGRRRVYRAKVMAFVVAAVTCGIAGALVAQQNQYINSDFISFHLSIFILLLVLFGGAGTMYGPLVGAVSADADRRAAGALAFGAALRSTASCCCSRCTSCRMAWRACSVSCFSSRGR